MGSCCPNLFRFINKKKNRMESEVVIVCVFFQQNANSDLFPFGVFVFETKRAKANSNIPTTFPFLSIQAISKDKTFG